MAPPELAAEAQPPPTAENGDAQSDCTIFEYDEPPEEEEAAEAAVSTWDDEMMTRPLCAKVCHPRSPENTPAVSFFCEN